MNNYVDIPGPIASLKQYSNVDYWYGPYDSIGEACNTIPESLRGLGLTVGILEDGEVVEYQWKRGTTDENLEKKVKKEEYGLIIEKFEAREIDEEGGILLTWKIGGNGINTTVSISGSLILNRDVHFGTTEHDMFYPKSIGTYTFSISVKDALGSKVTVAEGVQITKSVGFGNIELTVRFTGDFSIPRKSSYEGNIISFYGRYNSKSVRNLRLFFNELEISDFPSNGINSDRINYDYQLPYDSNIPAGSSIESYYTRSNVLKLTYDKYTSEEDLGTPGSYVIDTFSILGEDEYEIRIEDLEVGYTSSKYKFYVTIQYGGSEDINNINLNGRILKNNSPSDTVLWENLSTNRKYPLLLFIDDYTILNSDTFKLRVWFSNEGTEIYAEKDIIIKKSNTPNNPVGNYYFNNIKNTNYLPSNPNLLTYITPTNNIINWPGTSSETVYEIKNTPFFNFDINILTSQNGLDDNLITIYEGDQTLTPILEINKLTINSSIFLLTEYDSYGLPNTTYYLNNKLILPTNGEFVHIGFGYNRSFVEEKTIEGNTTKDFYYYSCIFINGEIAFCNKTSRTPTRLTKFTVKFNKAFQANELSFNTLYESESVDAGSIPNYTSRNAVDPSGQSTDTYDIAIGNDKDVFYWNWQTTLENINSDEDSLDILNLYPVDIGNSAVLATDRIPAEQLKDLGFEELAGLDDEHNPGYFVFFGKPVKGAKSGVKNTSLLFHLTTSDKEDNKYDKYYAVLCQYSFNDETPVSDKFCIVLVQGTSTLAYPVPNFLFTFIQNIGTTEEPNYELDTTNTLYYTKLTINQYSTQGIEEKNNFIYSEDGIEGESNIVAKADSMDSSHLNNTPTAIYYNALTTELFGENKFDSTYNDAIVGKPIILRIYEPGTTTYDDYGTFMLNTGKESKDMGLHDDSIISLEGLSNSKHTPAGIFKIYEVEEGVESIYSDDINNGDPFAIVTMSNRKEDIEDAMNSSNGVDSLTQELLDIIKTYLLNSAAFESRSKIKLKANKDCWKYLKFFFEAWWFIYTSSVDTTEDINTFRNTFEQYFDLNYAILYYIHLVLFGQTDNLGKNMMLDWKVNPETGAPTSTIFIRPYDLDSLLGLNNGGFDNVPVYACTSLEDFKTRLNNPLREDLIILGLPSDTYTSYNSTDSLLWQKFWKAYLFLIESLYQTLRLKYINKDNVIGIGEKLVREKISKHLYNKDFALKHLGTNYSYLNKGGRFLNYSDWIEKRFMYTDSYFKKYGNILPVLGLDDTISIGKTLVPTFYSIGYLERNIMIHWYGYYDLGYPNTIIESTLIYPLTLALIFECVPDSILKLRTPFPLTYFKNLRDFSGPVTTDFSGYLELLNLSLTSGIIDSSITFPPKISTLRLEHLRITTSELKFPDSLEELYINDCIFTKSFGIANKELLRKLSISNSEFLVDLELENLNLATLELYDKNLFNKLTIKKDITSNKILNLSGILCEEDLSIQLDESTNTEELYMDYIYLIDNKPYTIYSENIPNTPDYTQATLNNGTVITDARCTINYTNFPVENKDTDTPTYFTLDLSRSNLKVFSCVGAQGLEKLLLPNSIKFLNVQFCENLKIINSNLNKIDLSNFSNLSSKKCYILAKEYRTNRAIEGTDVRDYFYLKFTCPESFNLLGCKWVSHIVLGNSGSINSNFTGEYFVGGCLKLHTIDNLNTITFKTLYNSFRLAGTNINDSTTPLSLSDSNLILSSNFTSSGNLDYAFSCSNVAVNSSSGIYLLEVSARDVFSGIKIVEGVFPLGLEINWTKCLRAFASATLNVNNAENLRKYSYEYMCLGSTTFGKWTGSSANDSTIDINIKLLKANDVLKMFLSLPICINLDIFSGNTSSGDFKVSGFLANTRLNALVDFHNKTATDFTYCYENAKISAGNLTRTYVHNNFPSTMTVIENLFANISSLEIDVAGLFADFHSITNASGCFRGTKCYCSGNPFASDVYPDISSMFAKDQNIVPTHECNIDWVDSRMLISNYSIENQAKGYGEENLGVFEGNIIRISGEEDFELSKYNGSSSSPYISNKRDNASRFFANSTIYLGNNRNIILDIENCSSIFEGCTFEVAGNSTNSTILIESKVNTFNAAFKGVNGAIKVDLDNSRFRSANSCFEDSNLNITLNGTLPATLESAKMMFKNSNTIYILDDQGEPVGFFDNCTSLNYIDGIFWGHLNIGDWASLDKCTKLMTAKYAFYNAKFAEGSFLDKELFPNSLNNLTNIQGIFRNCDLNNYNSNISISGQRISNAKEACYNVLFNENRSITIQSRPLVSIDAIGNLITKSEDFNILIKKGPNNYTALLVADNKGRVSISPITSGGNIGSPTYTQNGWEGIVGGTSSSSTYNLPANDEIMELVK